MWEKLNAIRTKHRAIVYFVVLISIGAGVTPALAAYIGPNRTKTEIINVCKVVLYQCQFVPSKDIYRYKPVNDWSCSLESKPWRAYSSQPDSQGCTSSNSGDKYWEREETPQEVTNTYPPALINGSLQNCSLNNGWCISSPQLTLNASEPVPGYNIIAIEGTLNGQTFACSNSSCSVPLFEGDNSLTYWALSSWGDSSTMGNLTAKVDSKAPTISGLLSGTTGSNSWYLSPITFTGAASDATSGLASFTCTLDGNPLGNCSSFTINGEGVHTLVFNARDNAGNTNSVTQNASIDTQNPILTATLNGSLGSNTWYTAATLIASASDPTPGSGISVLEYNLDNNGWVNLPISGTVPLTDGKHSVDIRAVDIAGHTTLSSKSFWLDSLAPSISLEPTGTLGSNNWYVTNLSVLATANDEISGLDVFEYSLDNQSWTGYTAPITITDGLHSISFWVQDQAGLVTQVDRQYQVDTRPPQIAGKVTGTPGSNGWYVSDVTLSASAADPLPGSGIEAFTYILNGATEIPYADLIALEDGQHLIKLNAQDKAGLTYSIVQSLKVDTDHPELNITTSIPGWIKEDVTFAGTASDEGSGLAKVEISTDGQTWQAVTDLASWNYVWNTRTFSNGPYRVFIRVSDAAGLVTEKTIDTGIDNAGPEINMPVSWLQWDTITLDVWDPHSGVSKVSVEISDLENSGQKRLIELDPENFPLGFKWDRRLDDGTVAPAGTYDVQVTAIDKLGNVARKSSSVKILLSILPPGPTSTPQPPVRPSATPTTVWTPTATLLPSATPTGVITGFGTVDPTSQPSLTPVVSPTPRTTPTQTTIQDWLESIFLPNTNSTNQDTEVSSLASESTARSTDFNPNLLWGAAAAAMVGAVSTYAAEERQKQQAEKERLAASEIHKAERRKRVRSRKLQKIEAQHIQEALWEQAREEENAREAAYQAHLAARTTREEAQESKNWIASLLQIRQRWEEKKKAEQEKKKAEDLQAGLAAYYNANKQAESLALQAKQNTPLEKTLKWIDENQTELSIGIGVLAGVAAIVLSGGIATPLVAAAWATGAATVAGGTAALGTVLLNRHYGREWNENLKSNIIAAGGTAWAVAAAWFFTASPTVGAYCIANPTLCSRIEPVFKAIDAYEELALTAKLTYFTWRHDDRALELANELHYEYIDGGMPGNLLAKELGSGIKKLGLGGIDLVRKHGRDGLIVVEKYGDDGLEIVEKYGDDGVRFLQQYGDEAVEFYQYAKKLNINPADILHNPPLPGQSLEGWLLNITDLKSPVNKPSNLKLTKSEIDFLLTKSLHNTKSNEFVLGYFDPNKENGYVEVADRREAMKLSMPEDLYRQTGFKDDSGDFWQINRAAIQYGIDERKTFVLSTDLDTIMSRPEKFTYAEIQMILHPGNKYVHVHKDGYDMLVPAETLVP